MSNSVGQVLIPARLPSLNPSLCLKYTSEPNICSGTETPALNPGLRTPALACPALQLDACLLVIRVCGLVGQLGWECSS